MAFKAILLLILIMAVVFAWRAWRGMPALAVFAGAIAAAAGVLLLRTPLVALAGLLLAGVLIACLSRRSGSEK